MIIRLIAVDPVPRPGRSDVLVYQVPENSRELEVLADLLTARGIEWTTLSTNNSVKKKLIKPGPAT